MHASNFQTYRKTMLATEWSCRLGLPEKLSSAQNNQLQMHSPAARLLYPLPRRPLLCNKEPKQVSYCWQASCTSNRHLNCRRGHTLNASAATSWMFPWEKRQMDARGSPLRTWEKVYWGVFVTAISLFLFNRLKPNPQEAKV